MAYIGNNAVTQQFVPGADRFSGDGSTTAFTLSRPVGSVFDIQVSVDNVIQDPYTAYGVNGQTLTFTGAPLFGSYNIQVVYRSLVTQTIKPGAGTITTEAFSNQAINNVAIGSTTASSGAFTTLSASGTTTLSGNQVISVTDNSNAALRITQLGTGNALLVEDSTNPDASPFVIDSSGQVIQGITSSLLTSNNNGASADNISVGGGTVSGYAAVGSNSTTNRFAPNLTLKRNRGSFSSPTVVADADFVGRLDFQGHDGTGFIDLALIHAAVDGTPGTNDMPGRLVFSTTADGASSPTERMRIDSAGNVGIGTSSPSYKLDVFSVTNNSDIAKFTGGQAAKGLVISTYASNGNDGGAKLSSTDSLAFATASTERMRITSAGNVGIGTSSPVTKLQVVDGDITVTTSGSFSYLNSTRAFTPTNLGQLFGGVRFRAYSTGTTYVDGAQILAFSDGAAWSSTSAPTYLSFQTTASGVTTPTERMVLNSSGNLGLGVTPSAWTSGLTALQIRNANLWSSGTDWNAGANAFYGSSGWTYATSAAASAYQQAGGAHYWLRAGSGTAGNAITFTQAMTLDASGNLGIGTTSPSIPLDVVGNSGSNAIRLRGRSADNIGTLRFSSNNAATDYATLQTTASSLEISTVGALPMLFSTNLTERMRIDSSGNVGIGATPSAWIGVYRAIQLPFGTCLTARTDTPETLLGSNFYRDSGGFYRYLGTGPALSYYQTAGSHIWQNAASGTAGNTIAFTSVMTLDASGRLGIGTTSPAAVTGFTSNRGLVQISNASGNGQLRLGGDAGIMIDHDNTGTTIATLRNLYGATSASALLQIQSGYITFGTGTSYSERMRIRSDGGILSQPTGGGTLLEQFSCRAWVNFNGTGTVAIRGSGNVSSITDNSNGDYTVNFSNAMPDTNYATVLSNEANSGSVHNIKASGGTGTTPNIYTTSAVRIVTENTDSTTVSLAIFR